MGNSPLAVPTISTRVSSEPPEDFRSNSAGLGGIFRSLRRSNSNKAKKKKKKKYGADTDDTSSILSLPVHYTMDERFEPVETSPSGAPLRSRATPSTASASAVTTSSNTSAHYAERKPSIPNTATAKMSPLREAGQATTTSSKRKTVDSAIFKDDTFEALFGSDSLFDSRELDSLMGKGKKKKDDTPSTKKIEDTPSTKKTSEGNKEEEVASPLSQSVSKSKSSFTGKNVVPATKPDGKRSTYSAKLNINRYESYSKKLRDESTLASSANTAADDSSTTAHTSTPKLTPSLVTPPVKKKSMPLVFEDDEGIALRKISTTDKDEKVKEASIFGDNSKTTEIDESSTSKETPEYVEIVDSSPPKETPESVEIVDSSPPKETPESVKIVGSSPPKETLESVEIVESSPPKDTPESVEIVGSGPPVETPVSIEVDDNSTPKATSAAVEISDKSAQKTTAATKEYTSAKRKKTPLIFEDNDDDIFGKMKPLTTNSTTKDEKEMVLEVEKEDMFNDDLFEDELSNSKKKIPAVGTDEQGKKADAELETADGKRRAHNIFEDTLDDASSVKSKTKEEEEEKKPLEPEASLKEKEMKEAEQIISKGSAFDDNLSPVTTKEDRKKKSSLFEDVDDSDSSLFTAKSPSTIGKKGSLTTEEDESIFDNKKSSTSKTADVSAIDASISDPEDVIEADKKIESNSSTKIVVNEAEENEDFPSTISTRKKSADELISSDSVEKENTKNKEKEFMEKDDINTKRAAPKVSRKPLSNLSTGPKAREDSSKLTKDGGSKPSWMTELKKRKQVTEGSGSPASDQKKEKAVPEWQKRALERAKREPTKVGVTSKTGSSRIAQKSRSPLRSAGKSPKRVAAETNRTKTDSTVESDVSSRLGYKTRKEREKEREAKAAKDTDRENAGSAEKRSPYKTRREREKEAKGGNDQEKLERSGEKSPYRTKRQRERDAARKQEEKESNEGEIDTAEVEDGGVEETSTRHETREESEREVHDKEEEDFMEVKSSYKTRREREKEAKEENVGKEKHVETEDNFPYLTRRQRERAAAKKLEEEEGKNEGSNALERSTDSPIEKSDEHPTRYKTRREREREAKEKEVVENTEVNEVKSTYKTRREREREAKEQNEKENDQKKAEEPGVKYPHLTKRQRERDAARKLEEGKKGDSTGVRRRYNTDSPGEEIDESPKRDREKSISDEPKYPYLTKRQRERAAKKQEDKNGEIDDTEVRPRYKTKREREKEAQKRKEMEKQEEPDSEDVKDSNETKREREIEEKEETNVAKKEPGTEESEYESRSEREAKERVNSFDGTSPNETHSKASRPVLGRKPSIEVINQRIKSGSFSLEGAKFSPLKQSSISDMDTNSIKKPQADMEDDVFGSSSTEVAKSPSHLQSGTSSKSGATNGTKENPADRKSGETSEGSEKLVPLKLVETRSGSSSAKSSVSSERLSSERDLSEPSKLRRIHSKSRSPTPPSTRQTKSSDSVPEWKRKIVEKKKAGLASPIRKTAPSKSELASADKKVPEWQKEFLAKKKNKGDKVCVYVHHICQPLQLCLIHPLL